MAVVISGHVSHLEEEGGQGPADSLVLSRSMGIAWPGAGFTFAAMSLGFGETVPELRGSSGVWVPGWSLDWSPEAVGGEAHGRLWWRYASTAPEAVDITVGLDPPGYGVLTLYEAIEGSWRDRSEGSAVQDLSWLIQDPAEIARTLAEGRIEFNS